MERDLLVRRREAQAGKRRIELLQRQRGLQPPERGPMQKWIPRPKASVRRELSRSGSKRVGLGKTSASRPAAASQRKSFAPSGRSTPPSVTGRVVTRRQTAPTDRSTASRRPRPISAGSATSRAQRSGTSSSRRTQLPIRLLVVRARRS